MTRPTIALLWVLLLLDGIVSPHPSAQPLASPAEGLRSGIELARQGRIRDAIEEFRGYVAIAPDDPTGHLWLGRALLEQSMRDGSPSREGVSELERALELDSSIDAARTALIQVYGSRVPGLFRPDQALTFYEELLARYPRRPEIPLRFARWLLYSEIRLARRAPGRVLQDSAWGTERAISLLESVQQLVPSESEEALSAKALLADAQMRIGRWPQALASFRDLLEVAQERALNPARLHNLVGHVHFRRGDFSAAVEAFRLAYDGEPSPRYLHDLGLAYQRLGGYPEDLPATYRFPYRKENLPPSPSALLLEDIAPELGIDKLAGAGPCGWADYNLDGLYDLLVCGANVFCSLYKATDERFVASEVEAEIGQLEPGFGAAWADYDNDGDPDLYISRNGWNGTAPNSLLRNNGDGTFTDVADWAGVADAGSSFHSAWFDYDRDGWLDLVVSNGVYLDGSTNQLYRNQGDGTFRNVTARAGLSEPAGWGTIGVALGDYDNDGWPDIFFHGRMEPNRLYRSNRDGTFTDVASEAGVAGSGRQNGYIALMADLDSDGDLDIFTGSMEKWDEVIAGYREGYQPGPLDNIPRLYRNNGDGTFSDDSLAVGLRYPLGIMAGAVADLDNDGFLDVYLGTGNPDLARLEPNIFYHNRGGRRFEDLTRSTGLGVLGKGHGITFIDWDGDGDLEMFAQLGGFYHGDLSRSAFFLNRAGNRNHWLSLRLRQPELNRDAIGARVTLRTEGWSQVQEVTAGRGFSSTDPPILHFGLGAIERIDQIVIRWPDGATKELREVAVDQRLEVERASATN